MPTREVTSRSRKTTTPMLSMPTGEGSEREVAMKAEARRVVAEHGAATALYFAALLDEAAEDVEEGDAPVGG